MRKKDYVKFAKMLSIEWNGDSYKDVSFELNVALCIRFESLVDKISDIFINDNPRFDYQRFRDAVYHGKGI